MGKAKNKEIIKKVFTSFLEDVEVGTWVDKEDVEILSEAIASAIEKKGAK